MSRPIESSERWKAAALAYAQHINAYIAKGDACNWKKMGEPDAPPDLTAEHPALMAALRAANAQGTDAAITQFREQWPPLYEAIQPLLDGNSQGFTALAWLPNGDLLVRTGAWYEPGSVLAIHGLQVTALPDVEMFGTSPNHQVLALASAESIRLVNSVDASPLAEFKRPEGSEGLPTGYPTGDDQDEGESPKVGIDIQQLIPFDDASGCVVVQSAGVFIVRAAGVQRLLPLREALDEAMEGGEPYPVRLDMVHAAVSPDGQWIACGEQDGEHKIFNAQAELVDKIGPHGEYPHHAAFFADGKHVALNACHFYNGGTIAVDVSAFGSIGTDFYEEHPAVTAVDSSARVYASAPTGDSLVLGDANGYLWVRNPKGELQWKQHLGSTISAMAASPDGKTLAVGSYSGTVHIIDLSNLQPSPEQVGKGARREQRRWLFWKGEAQPLAW